MFSSLGFLDLGICIGGTKRNWRWMRERCTFSSVLGCLRYHWDTRWCNQKNVSVLTRQFWIGYGCFAFPSLEVLGMNVIVGYSVHSESLHKASSISLCSVLLGFHFDCLFALMMLNLFQSLNEFCLFFLNHGPSHMLFFLLWKFLNSYIQPVQSLLSFRP